MPKPTSQRGYPLAALFVLIAVCAILLAMLGPVVRATLQGIVGAGGLVSAVFGSALWLGVLGAIVGAHHHRRSRGMVIGVVTGAVVGMLIGPLVVAPNCSFPSLIAAGLGGSAALLLVGVVVRLSTRG